MLTLLNVYYIQKKYWAAPQWIKKRVGLDLLVSKNKNLNASSY